MLSFHGTPTHSLHVGDMEELSKSFIVALSTLLFILQEANSWADSLVKIGIDRNTMFMV